MNEMQIFKNEEFGEIRIVAIDGEPWLVGKDVAAALGYSNPRDALAKHVDNEDRDTVAIRDGTSGNPNVTIINESGLYSLVLSSKLPGAKQFRRWVTSEVLPSIRKNGGYFAGQDDISASDAEILSRAMAVAQRVLAERDERIKRLSRQNEIMQPKADYFDDLVDRNTLTGIRETAKELGCKPKKFVAYLIENKYLYRDQKGQLQPYAGNADYLFVLKECKSSRNSWSGTQLLVTPKGRETFRLLLKSAPLCATEKSH